MEWFLVFSLYRFSVFWASLGVFDSLGLHVLLRKGKFAFVVFDTRVFLSGHGSPISCIGFGLGVLSLRCLGRSIRRRGDCSQSQVVIINSFIGLGSGALGKWICLKNISAHHSLCDEVACRRNCPWPHCSPPTSMG
jgi:hypothetical protein